MSSPTVSVKELELLAAKLRDTIRRNPGYTEWEQEQLIRVEEWIESVRQEDEAEVPVGAEAG